MPHPKGGTHNSSFVVSTIYNYIIPYSQLFP